MNQDLIAFDALLDVCADRHRRIVLAVLAGEQRRLTVNDLAKAIVKHNHHVPVTETSGGQLSKLGASLHHVHLPKIEESGLVTYDPERRLVESTERFEQVQPKLSTLIEADPALEPPIEL